MLDVDRRMFSFNAHNMPDEYNDINCNRYERVLWYSDTMPTRFTSLSRWPNCKPTTTPRHTSGDLVMIPDDKSNPMCYHTVPNTSIYETVQRH